MAGTVAGHDDGRASGNGVVRLSSHTRVAFWENMLPHLPSGRRVIHPPHAGAMGVMRPAAGLGTGGGKEEEKNGV
jgi:hypothetical protein